MKHIESPLQLLFVAYLETVFNSERDYEESPMCVEDFDEFMDSKACAPLVEELLSEALTYMNLPSEDPRGRVLYGNAGDRHSQLTTLLSFAAPFIALMLGEEALVAELLPALFRFDAETTTAVTHHEDFDPMLLASPTVSEEDIDKVVEMRREVFEKLRIYDKIIAESNKLFQAYQRIQADADDNGIPDAEENAEPVTH